MANPTLLERIARNEARVDGLDADLREHSARSEERHKEILVEIRALREGAVANNGRLSAVLGAGPLPETVRAVALVLSILAGSGIGGFVLRAEPATTHGDTKPQGSTGE